MTATANRVAFSPEDLRRVEEIERLGRGGGVEQLIDMLDDPSWAVRRAARVIQEASQALWRLLRVTAGVQRRG